MKKFILVLAAVLGITVVAAAQPRAVGLRLGYGAEISYQHTLGGANFGEIDLGWSLGFINASVAYDFNICPVGPLNFYAGPQVNVGLVSGAGVVLGAGAQLGLEYIFPQIPLQLSLDWKPTFYFIPATAFGWQGIALGVRYVF